MKREDERDWGDWEGVGKRGVNGNFYNLIKLLSKKKSVHLKDTPSRSPFLSLSLNNKEESVQETQAGCRQ